jgi:NitT/TauT family transport system ATP-binding protein
MPYRLEGVSRRFGELLVLECIDLTVDEGSMLVILGPSGCGKTSLLKVVAGLDTGHTGTRRGFESCRFSFAFQEPRLLPWASVLENVLFALSSSGLEREDAVLLARRLLDLAGLGTFETRKPFELSGGMRQRVSLVRAFAYPANFLVLDEAFQSVDIRLKQELMALFVELRELEPKTALLVTHDPTEALLLADRVIVLSPRPARIVDDFSIEIARKDRFPGSPRLADSETRLYAGLLG